MKTSKLLAAAALTLFAAVGAQAETYDGVLAVNSTQSRAEVNAQAVATARIGNVYADGANAGLQPRFDGVASRSAVRTEAFATAHAPNQNLDRKAFVNSTVPAAYTNGTLKIRTVRQAAL